MRSFIERERGASMVVVAVALTGFIAAAVLAVDSGSVWQTRRAIITATDAAALEAAWQFNSQALDPCVPTDVAAAEAGATSIMLQNEARALHDAVATPNGFEVTPMGPCTGGYTPGKVRFDGRLPATLSFAGIFGADSVRPISSSTAAWGYVTAVGNGLRPFAVCDQRDVVFPDPLPPAPAAPYYPQYHLWNELWHGDITQAEYDSFFGTDPDRYPSVSTNWDDEDPKNPNWKKAYVTPDGTNGHSTIMRITMSDPDCGVSPGNRIWINFEGPEGGSIGASTLREWLLNGYPGTVSLDPHDCNVGDGISPQDCGGKPGDNAGVRNVLAELTCDVNTPALSCPYIFPIIVAEDVTEDGGSNVHYNQVAFLTVVLRGFARPADTFLQFDFEFVDQQISGQVGASPPSPDHPYQTGVQLCGIDHDSASDRCF